MQIDIDGTVKQFVEKYGKGPAVLLAFVAAVALFYLGITVGRAAYQLFSSTALLGI
jgi:hypothetical protein